MRAYRPGVFARDGYEEEFHFEREQKLQLYTERARAGLPLFDPHVQSERASDKRSPKTPPR